MDDIPKELIAEINEIGSTIDVLDEEPREHPDMQIISGLFVTMFRSAGLRTRDYLRSPEIEDVKVIAAASAGTLATVGVLAYADDALRFTANSFRSTYDGVVTLYEVMRNRKPIQS